jgi:hypothetical protein
MLMALIMALGRWLRLAFVQPFLPPAPSLRAPQKLFWIARAPQASLALIHARPPDPGR